VKAAACVAALLLAATGAGAEGKPPEGKLPEGKLHEVKRGESLAVIAGHELGDPALWPVLYRANRDRIKDPQRIYPGQRISIPAPGEALPEAAPDAPGEDDE
jgi:nucleoid-associated protein YgaU